MTDLHLLAAALFLPLFPLSMLFNAFFNRVQHAVLRGAILIVWPHIGLAIIHASASTVPEWMTTLALVTALLYALRMLALRGVGQWTGFLATSMWAVLWLAASDVSQSMHHLYALGLSIPLVLLVSLSAGLEKRFGAAYTGLYEGLALSIPRFSGVLVVVVLAAIATPIFPAFFIMLSLILATGGLMPFAAVSLLITWLLWSWAGVRLLQGLIVGNKSEEDIADLSLLAAWAYAIILIALILSSMFVIGSMS